MTTRRFLYVSDLAILPDVTGKPEGYSLILADGSLNIVRNGVWKKVTPPARAVPLVFSATGIVKPDTVAAVTVPLRAGLGGPLNISSYYAGWRVADVTWTSSAILIASTTVTGTAAVRAAGNTATFPTMIVAGNVSRGAISANTPPIADPLPALGHQNDLDVLLTLPADVPVIGSPGISMQVTVWVLPPVIV